MTDFRIQPPNHVKRCASFWLHFRLFWTISHIVVNGCEILLFGDSNSQTEDEHLDASFWEYFRLF